MSGGLAPGSQGRHVTGSRDAGLLSPENACVSANTQKHCQRENAGLNKAVKSNLSDSSHSRT